MFHQRPRIVQAPPLPAHFVPRPEVTRDLKARLLATGPTEPGVPTLCALQGMGGIGKTTLAAALAYDPEVQVRFPDAVLWATLGQQPDILSLLSGWVQALGDYQFKPLVVETASTHLRSLLQDKAALIVVDDVWDPDHVRPFLVGGPSCRVLITTRRAAVADEAVPIPLDVLTPEQSLDLLAAHLGRALGPAERDDARRLAEAVGFLPLALELAAVRVKRGVSWTELHRALEAEVARLEELEDPLRRRKGQARLKASFNYSLRALRAEDQAAYEAFAGLGLLPEDAAIAAPMAATLWKVEEAEAGGLLEILWSESLLLPGRTLRAYRLHDLLHDLARSLLTTPSGPTRPDDLPGLGMTMREAHGRLLERYRARTRGGLWHTLPDDGYIHAHLTWHLEQAGAPEGLHGLLREETAEGRNGWYEARERLGQVAGYLLDLARAWGSVDQHARDRPHGIGLQCRYALITTSLNSQAGNIPTDLLAALMESGTWLPSQALAYARQVPDAEHQVKAFSRLLLFPRLSEHERDQALSQALEAARAIGDEWWRAWALAALAPHLTPPLLGPALEAARAIGAVGSRARALAALAPHLTPPERDQALSQALEAARAIGDEESRARGAGGAGAPPDAPPARTGPGGGAGDRGRVVAGPGAGGVGAPPDAPPARTSPGGGAGDRGRGVAGPGAGGVGAPPDAPPARTGPGGGAGDRGRGVAGPGAGGAGAPPDAPRARPGPRTGPGGGAGDQGRGIAGRGAGGVGAPPDAPRARPGPQPGPGGGAGDRGRGVAGLGAGGAGAPPDAPRARPGPRTGPGGGAGDRGRGVAGPGVGGVGAPPDAPRARPGPQPGPGGGAGDRGRGVVGRGAGGAGAPPDAPPARTGPGGGAGDRGRGVAGPGAWRRWRPT